MDDENATIIRNVTWNATYKPADGKREGYALCIGPTGPYYGLKYTDDDAKLWAETLIGYGYHVDVLIGYITARDLINALERILEEADADDYVAIVYSGHGESFYHDINGYSYYESCIYLPDNTDISQWVFKDFNDNLSSKHIFYFFDACMIGGMRIIGAPNPLSDKEIYVAMGSDNTSESYDDPNLQHGVFTYYFIEGLNPNYNPKNAYCIEIDHEKYYVPRFDAEFAFDYAKDHVQSYNMSPTAADNNHDTYFCLNLMIYGSGWHTPIHESIAVISPT